MCHDPCINPVDILYILFKPQFKIENILKKMSIFVFACIGVQHKLCCVFLYLVYSMLPISLGCLFVIAPSVFSNVYLGRNQCRNPFKTNLFLPLFVRLSSSSHFEINPRRLSTLYK